jgi:hypothetical protein
MHAFAGPRVRSTSSTLGHEVPPFGRSTRDEFGKQHVVPDCGSTRHQTSAGGLVGGPGRGMILIVLVEGEMTHSDPLRDHSSS